MAIVQDSMTSYEAERAERILVNQQRLGKLSAMVFNMNYTR